MQDIKVLVADDEKDILDVMEKKLKEEGYQVVTAVDGEDAWRKINAEDPDVILLDLIMPNIDGFTVLERLRRNPPSLKWQPVIIVSALGELEDMKRGFNLEADHYITKPCNMEDVLKSVRLMVSLIPQRRSQFDAEDKKK